MIAVDNIRSLSEFQRNTRAHIRRLSRTGRPEVLTVNGKARIVVQDAVAYQALLDQLEDAKTALAVEESERGEGVPFDEAFAAIRRRSAKRRKQ